ncbi:MAG TPA: FkbM family methyltransferase [Gammaproteobacteria bacterium]|nr:FkbM family methyltransferase [Gammaproteobacteria bacterium]
MQLWDKLHMRLRFARYRRRKEADEIRFLRSLPLAGKTLIDIGANKGVYCYWLSRAAGPEGRVYAFEPQPELVHHLHALAGAFGLDNLRLENCALSDRDGRAGLYRQQAGAGDAALDPAGGPERLEVPVTTLDAWAARERLAGVAFIKCDVEGHELAVLRGARGVLGKYAPVLQVEIHHRDAHTGAVFDLLEGLGYEGFFWYAGKRLPAREFSCWPDRKPGLDHRNYLFLPPSAGF